MSKSRGKREVYGQCQKHNVTSHLEWRFVQAWGDRLPRFVYQYRVPSTPFTADFAWVEERVILEIQGGVFTRGAHGRGAGIAKDYARNNALVERDWRVIYLTADRMTRHTLEDALAQVERILAGERPDEQRRLPGM